MASRSWDSPRSDRSRRIRAPSGSRSDIRDLAALILLSAHQLALPLAMGTHMRIARLRPDSAHKRFKPATAPHRAFPDHDHFPTERTQFTNVRRIPSNVAVDLMTPERATCLRPHRIAAAMVVPETPVNEHHGSVLSENNIRTPRQTARVEPKSQRCSV